MNLSREMKKAARVGGLTNTREPRVLQNGDDGACADEDTEVRHRVPLNPVGAEKFNPGGESPVIRRADLAKCTALSQRAVDGSTCGVSCA
jgi:hypothetical protein